MESNLAGIISDIKSVGSSKLMIIFAGLANSSLIARFLGPEANGTIAALMVYPTLFMTIGSLGIRQSTAFFLGKNIYSEDEIKASVMLIWIISTAFSVSSCYFLIRFFSKVDEGETLIILAISAIPFNLFVTYCTGVFLGKNDIKQFSRFNWIPPVASLTSTFALVVVFRFGITGALVGPIAGAFLVALLLFRLLNFGWSLLSLARWQIVWPLLKLGLVYATALLIMNLNYKVDIILLDQLTSKEQLGIYSIGAKLMEYLWQIPMLLSTIIFARSANSSDGLEFSRKTSQILRISFILVGTGGIFLALLADWVIFFLFGAAFGESALILRIMLPGVVLLTIFKVLNMDLAGKGKPWISLQAMVPSLVLNVALNLILIPKVGAVGAAISSMISYSCAAVIFLRVYSKQVGLSITEITRFHKSDFGPILRGIKKARKKT